MRKLLLLLTIGITFASCAKEDNSAQEEYAALLLADRKAEAAAVQAAAQAAADALAEAEAQAAYDALVAANGYDNSLWNNLYIEDTLYDGFYNRVWFRHHSNDYVLERGSTNDGESYSTALYIAYDLVYTSGHVTPIILDKKEYRRKSGSSGFETISETFAWAEEIINNN